MKKDARVKAVETNHMKASLWEAALVLQHAVEVLAMTKGRQPISIRGIEQSTIRGARSKECSGHLSHPTMDGSVIAKEPGKGDMECSLHSPHRVPN